MSFVLGIIGAFVLTDAFDGTWTTRREWEVVTGLAFIAAACIVYWVSRGED